MLSRNKHLFYNRTLGKIMVIVIHIIIERKSNFLFVTKLPCNKTVYTTNNMGNKRKYSDKILSFTTDNGSEFAYHTLSVLDTYIPHVCYYIHFPWKKAVLNIQINYFRDILRKGLIFLLFPYISF